MDSKTKVDLVLNPLDYGGVVLKKGKFKLQFDEMLEYFLAIPNDDILYGFRKRAGLPHPGNEPGGWYCNDQSFNPYEWDEIFNVFGQWLSLFGRAYKVTGDQRLIEKARYLLGEWGKAIEEDGYFFYSWDCNAYHYSFEKIESGLVDLYVYGGLQEAADYLKKVTEWAEKNLHRFRNPSLAHRDVFTGGEESIKFVDNEWYTLSEGLYRAYLATGDERYRDFAQIWHYDYYWDGLRADNPDVMTRVHGYSHVNTLGGAAMAYRVSGDKKYLDTLTHGYDLIKKYQWMASGGYAFDEHMADPGGSNYKDVESIGKSFEVPCGTWAIFKAVRHLISLTGEARYGEWAETALYNAIGGALPMKDDSQRRGKTFYYADYRLGGGRKVYYECSFPCCSGTYPQAVTEYHNMIYYLGERGVYITQYIPSILDTCWNQQQIRLEISGNYPETDAFQILVHSAGDYQISLRAPSWIVPGEATVSVNGQPLTDIEIAPNEWIKLSRQWSESDMIEVRFPMHLRSAGISEGHPERAALMYGPVMLAAEGRHSTLQENPEDLKEMEESKEGLTFRSQTKEGTPLCFRPYWTYGERKWYSVYLDFTKE